jgi:hypothetical protein
LHNHLEVRYDEGVATYRRLRPLATRRLPMLSVNAIIRADHKKGARFAHTYTGRLLFADGNRATVAFATGDRVALATGELVEVRA